MKLSKGLSDLFIKLGERIVSKPRTMDSMFMDLLKANPGESSNSVPQERHRRCRRHQ